MRKTAKIAILLFFDVTISRPVYAETIEQNNSLQNGEKHFFTASAETLFVNALFYGATKYLGDFDWAGSTAESIHNNFTLPWQWEDTDNFFVNQLGHPYQGSLFYNAGRANGFSFYESMLFTSMGAVTWEIFGELQRASINDSITTTLVGPSLGEMLHRLYFSAYQAGIPLPFLFLISPMDMLNQLITGRPPPSINGSVYELSFFTGLNYTQTRFSILPEETRLFSFNGFTGSAGIHAVYGDPFEQYSITPYEQFDLKISLGLDMGNHIDMRVISDGYLVSFSPVNTKQDRMSTGLTLHFDFVSLGRFEFDSTIDQYSNALDWSIKYQHLFQNGLAADLKLHAGFTFLGVSDYFSPDTESNTLKNYGRGINTKFSLVLDKEKLGRFSLDVNQYFLWSYTAILPFSSGKVYWIFADASYAYPVSEHISLGISNSFAFERARFDGFPGLRKWSNTIGMFIKWSLK